MSSHVCIHVTYLLMYVYMWHVLSIHLSLHIHTCVTWLNCVHNQTLLTYIFFAHSRDWPTRLYHKCDATHPNVWGDSFIRVAWLISVGTVTHLDYNFFVHFRDGTTCLTHTHTLSLSLLTLSLSLSLLRVTCRCIHECEITRTIESVNSQSVASWRHHTYNQHVKCCIVTSSHIQSARKVLHRYVITHTINT